MVAGHWYTHDIYFTDFRADSIEADGQASGRFQKIPSLNK